MPDSPERDEDAKPVPPPASPAWRTLWLGFDVVLGRAPSDAESAHWLTHFANGFMPWDLVAVLSGGAEEPADAPRTPDLIAAMIQATFWRFLGRPASGGDIAIWQAAVAGGAVWNFFDLIAGSDEARNHRRLRGGGTRLRAVWLGFDVVLRRAPSDAELAHWLENFANGFMPWDLVAVLAGGAETPADAAQVPERIAAMIGATFWRFLRRPASDEDVAIWQAAIADGAAWSFFDLVANATEARSKCSSDAGALANLSAAELADAFLRPVLGRALSVSELLYWRRRLEPEPSWRRVEVLGDTSRNIIEERVIEASTPPVGADTVPIMGTDEELSPELWNDRLRRLPDQRGTDRAEAPRYVPRGRIRVTAIASVYRGAPYIDKFLETMLEQSLGSDFELLVIDADSPDGERSSIERAARQHPNIRYHRCDHRIGIYAAWNLGIRAARGDYITNVNLDDIRHRRSLEIQAQTLDDHPWVDVVYQDFYYTLDFSLDFDTIARLGFKSHLPPVTRANLMRFNSPHNAPMWRRSLHDEVGFFDEYLQSAGDYDFWMRCAIADRTFLKINEPHVAYFWNPAGVSTRRDGPGYEEGMRLLDKRGRSLVSPLLFADDAALRATFAGIAGGEIAAPPGCAPHDVAYAALERLAHDRHGDASGSAAS